MGTVYSVRWSVGVAKNGHGVFYMVRYIHLYWTLKMPLTLPLCKLFSYGIGGKTMKWIDAFLCFRQQKVVVNGISI